MNFYDKSTGQSVFLGPGSYNAQEKFNKITAIPTPGIMVRIQIY